MVDHGFAFGGPQWEFQDAPLLGLYYRRRVYADVTCLGDFEPWLERVEHFPETVLDEAYRSVPRRWLEPREEEALERLLERLLERRRKVRGLLEDCATSRQNVFPAWRG
jgi:hypothetical protein